MRRILLCAMSASLLLSGTLAQAATLGEASGTVLANFGQGYRPVAVTDQLPPGTQVTVRPGGFARIGYDDLCVRLVQPGQVYTVGQQSPCANAAQTVPTDPLTTDYYVAAGVAAAVGAGVLIFQLTRPSSP